MNGRGEAGTAGGWGETRLGRGDIRLGQEMIFAWGSGFVRSVKAGRSRLRGGAQRGRGGKAVIVCILCIHLFAIAGWPTARRQV